MNLIKRIICWIVGHNHIAICKETGKKCIGVGGWACPIDDYAWNCTEFCLVCQRCGKEL